MPVDALNVARPRRLVEVVVGSVLQAQETWTSLPHRCVCVCYMPPSVIHVHVVGW